jgi:hypothetical protein
MDVQESQSNWPEMRKTLGKPGFCSGEDRNRTFRCFSNDFEEFERQSPWNRNDQGVAIVFSVARE